MQLNRCAIARCGKRLVRGRNDQVEIMARLERQPGMSQNELAAIAEVAPITVARLVDRLGALGLVERCTDRSAHLASAIDAGSISIRRFSKRWPQTSARAARKPSRRSASNSLRPT
jgi:MarR family